MNPVNHPESEPSLNLLIDYVDGRLDEATARQLENQLEYDEKAAGVVAGIKSFYEQHGHDREKLKAWLEASEQRIQEKLRKYHTPQKRTLLPWLLPVAASIVLLLGVVYFFFMTPASDAPAMVSAYLEAPYPSPELFRDTGNASQQWIIAYRNENYAEVADSLQARMAAGQTGAEIKFYAALCLLYQANPDYEQASGLLEEVANSGNIYRQPAQWYLALAHYQAGDIEKAKSYLQKIMQTPGHVNQEEAEQLILNE